MTSDDSQPDQPLISVVLTTYNRKSILVRAVDSVLTGTYHNFELLIVDDASTDGTPEYARGLADPRIRYIRLPDNGGVLRARNRGFDEAVGTYVTTLDDDDELMPDALETVAREFGNSANDAIGVIWFDCVDVESGETSGHMPVKDGVLRFEDYLCGRISGDFWLVFRRTALDGFRFDERLKANESLLWLRIHSRHKARHVGKMLCRKYRRHGGPRLSDVDVRMEQLQQTTLAMTQFIDEFGPQLAEVCPRVYGAKLAYLGLHQMATGEFSMGRTSIRASLPYTFSAKYAALCLTSFLLSKGTVERIIRRIETTAESKQVQASV